MEHELDIPGDLHRRMKQCVKEYNDRSIGAAPAWTLEDLHDHDRVAAHVRAADRRRQDVGDRR